MRLMLSYDQGWHHIFQGGGWGTKFGEHYSELETFRKIRVYPLSGVQNRQFEPLCYCEGSLIVIEKCYSWQNYCKTDV